MGGADPFAVMELGAFLHTLDTFAPFGPHPDVPELSVWQCDDVVPLWQQLELLQTSDGRPPGDTGGPVPYFAIAWPAAALMARLLLDGVIDVRGQTVADVGCGSGLVSVAAARAGARTVTAIDVDPLATTAADALARRHSVKVHVATFDALAKPHDVTADVVIVADLVSRQQHAAPFAGAVDAWRGVNKRVFVVDSGRPFFSAGALTLLTERDMVLRSKVDGSGSRLVRVFQS